MRFLPLFLLSAACSTATPAAPAPPVHAPVPPVRSDPIAPAPVPAPADAPADPDTLEAVAALTAYYAALDAHQYPKAFRQWEDDGKASGQTLKSFTAGFADTAHTRVVVGTPGRVEGAAGSLYLSVPADVYATLKNGTEQHFRGTYDLRKANLPTEGQPPPSWHLHAADLKVATP